MRRVCAGVVLNIPVEVSFWRRVRGLRNAGPRRRRGGGDPDVAARAQANGVRRVWVAKDGLASTPAVSALIREGGPVWKKVFGAFILTASHNPGGPNEDFGIKYNCENGGPAPEKLTDLIYKNTTSISEIKICDGAPDVDCAKLGETVVRSRDGSCQASVEVVDGVAAHLDLLETVFDLGPPAPGGTPSRWHVLCAPRGAWVPGNNPSKVLATFEYRSRFCRSPPRCHTPPRHIHVAAAAVPRPVHGNVHVSTVPVFRAGAIKALLDRPDFSICFDAMHGVTGPYAKSLFVEKLGQPASCLLNAVPKDDFGGHHADPNLTYAVDLTKKMGVDRLGQPVGAAAGLPAFGAASDGDGDRNMVLGNRRRAGRVGSFERLPPSRPTLQKSSSRRPSSLFRFRPRRRRDPQARSSS